MSSALVQRTVVPTGTVRVAGKKLKLSILTTVSVAGCEFAEAAKALDGLPIPAVAKATVIAKIHNLLFISLS
jgi:hypothetical protein